MPEYVMQWPLWPEFSPSSGPAEKHSQQDSDAEFLSVKKSIIAEYSEERLLKAWSKTCDRLRAVTDDIIARRHDIIPVIDAGNVLENGFSQQQQDEIRRVGSMVIRQTIPRNEAESLYSDLTTYVRDNGDRISGFPEHLDLWDLGRRQAANQYLYPGPAHSTVLRSSQVWTALTPTAPCEGTILVYPNAAAVIAYVLLRPFFRPTNPTTADQEATAGSLDPQCWTLDIDTGSFPGTCKPKSQRLSRTSHPHLRLEECMVHVPALQPSDTFWWHTDVTVGCHS